MFALRYRVVRTVAVRGNYEREVRGACRGDATAVGLEAFQEVERGERDFLVGHDHACSTGVCDVVGEEAV